MVDVVHGGDVVDEDLDAEAGAVGDEQQPHTVVGTGRLEAVPATAFATTFAAFDGGASGAQVRVIAFRAILRIAPVQHGHHQHQHARHEQGDAPAQRFGHAQHQHGAEQQRHQRLCRTAARIAPAGGGGIRRAHHAGRKHHRGVILRDDKAGTDGADAQAKEQKAFIALRSGHAQHGNGAQQQQARVRLARAVAVAQGADDQAHEDGDGDGRDIDIRHLRQGKAELALDDRHQRCTGEPGEETHEKCHPRQVECPHGRRGEGEERDARCFLAGHDRFPKYPENNKNTNKNGARPRR